MDDEQLPDYLEQTLTARREFYKSKQYADVKELVRDAAVGDNVGAVQLVQYALALRLHAKNRHNLAEFRRLVDTDGRGCHWWRSFCSSLWMLYTTENRMHHILNQSPLRRTVSWCFSLCGFPH